jgi:hypothetical protein
MVILEGQLKTVSRTEERTLVSGSVLLTTITANAEDPEAEPDRSSQWLSDFALDLAPDIDDAGILAGVQAYAVEYNTLFGLGVPSDQIYC